MKSVRYERTLLYYDGPQVFLARDLSRNAFVGVLIRQGSTSDTFVVVQVERTFLEMFSMGCIDLLRLLLARVGPGWYLAEVSDGFEGLISLNLQSNSLEDFPHLPKPGLFIEEAQRRFEDVTIAAELNAVKYLGYTGHIHPEDYSGAIYSDAAYAASIHPPGLTWQPDLEFDSAPNMIAVQDKVAIAGIIEADADTAFRAYNNRVSLAA